MTLSLTMTGTLRDCVLLSYRTPAKSIRDLLPRGLEPVTRGSWAFWNIVACRVERMRPAGLPAAVGISYHHVAYRLYARARLANGQSIDGLYFVRSDADNALISGAGNLLSDFLFHRADVRFDRQVDQATGALTVSVSGTRGDTTADALLRVGPAGAFTPPDHASPFNSIEEARAFLKYRPLGLSCDVDGKVLRLAEVLRDESRWRETPLKVLKAHWNFFKTLDQNEVHLETATRVAPLPYHWRLGRRERLWSPSAHGLRITPAH